VTIGHGAVICRWCSAGAVVGSDGFGFARDDGYVKVPQLGGVRPATTSRSALN
jgi:UDP-3-O-[3-hydroxymyristoyl] glucosamine N-acyltransferase